MFVHVILVHVVEVAIVQIVHMAVMTNRGVPAVRAMPMSVVGMVFLGASGHRQGSSLTLGLPATPHSTWKWLRGPPTPRCTQVKLIADI
jgi:hypothetical protein